MAPEEELENLAEEEEDQFDEHAQEQDQYNQEEEGSFQEEDSKGSFEEDEFNPYAFIKSLPNYNLVAPLRPPIAVAPKSKDAPPVSL
jgi:hypothetical protein